MSVHNKVLKRDCIQRYYLIIKEMSLRFFTVDVVVGMKTCVLFCAQASLDAVNERLSVQIPMDRFRPKYVSHHSLLLHSYYLSRVYESISA